MMNPLPPKLEEDPEKNENQESDSNKCDLVIYFKWNLTGSSWSISLFF